MHIKTNDQRKQVGIKVRDLIKKTRFTLVGSDEVLVVMDIPHNYQHITQCFNITQLSTVNIDDHLLACPCDIEITILDKEVKNGIKA